MFVAKVTCGSTSLSRYVAITKQVTVMKLGYFHTKVREHHVPVSFCISSLFYLVQNLQAGFGSLNLKRYLWLSEPEEQKKTIGTVLNDMGTIGIDMGWTGRGWACAPAVKMCRCVVGRYLGKCIHTTFSLYTTTKNYFETFKTYLKWLCLRGTGWGWWWT